MDSEQRDNALEYRQRLKDNYRQLNAQMAQHANTKDVRTLLYETNNVFDKLMSLCIALPDDSSLPGSVSHKDAYLQRQHDIANKVNKWLMDCEESTAEATLEIERLHSRSNSGSRRTVRSQNSSKKLRLARLNYEQAKEEQLEATMRASLQEEEAELLAKTLDAKRQATDAKIKAMEAEIRLKKAKLMAEMAEIEENSSRSGSSTSKHYEAVDETHSAAVVHMLQDRTHDNGRTYSPDVGIKSHLSPQSYAPHLTDSRKAQDTYDQRKSAAANERSIGRDNYETDKRNRPSLREYAPYETRLSPKGDPLVVEVGERFLPKPSIEKFDGDPMDYAAFENRYQVHIRDKIKDDDLKLAYLLQHCTKRVYDKVKHLAGDRNKYKAYRLVWRELYERYGQPHVVSRCCEKRLQELPKIGVNDPEGLENLAVLVKRCLTSMEDFTGLSSMDSVGFIISIVNKLPIDLKKEWVSFAVKVEKTFGRIAIFYDFAEFIIDQSAKANSVYSKAIFNNTSSKTETMTSRRLPGKAFASVAAESSKPENKRDRISCPCCNRPHKLDNCNEFQRKTIRSRRMFVRNAGLCYKCFDRNHLVADCRSTIICRKEGCTDRNHHPLLHITFNQNNHDRQLNDEHQETNERACFYLGSHKHRSTPTRNNSVYLDIVPVRVRAGSQEVQTYALLDSGANKTFCERDLIKSLGVQLNEEATSFMLSTLLSETPKCMNTSAVQLTVLPLNDNDGEEITLNALVERIPASPNPAPVTEVISNFDYLQGVH